MDKVDKHKGVDHRVLANLERKKTNMLGSATHIAIVGHWKFNIETSTLECESFFYIPYPMTRVISSSRESSLRQFLYKGRGGEIFCFFDNTYHKKSDKDTYSSMSICELNLNATSDRVLQ